MSRTVVVTGANAAVGAAVTAKLRAAEHTVITVDVRDADVVANFSTSAGRAAALAAIKQAAPTTGVDAVIACQESTEERPEALRANYFGVTEIATGLRESLAKTEAPRVVIIGNVAAHHNVDLALVEACLAGDPKAVDNRLPQIADRGYVLFPSAKAALHRWARRNAPTELWAGSGITINVVAPGLLAGGKAETETGDLANIVATDVPMPLNGPVAAETVAGVATWLVSPDNTHVTGQVIYVDGGADAAVRGEETF